MSHRRTIDTRTGLEWLDRDECLRLLAADEFDRDHHTGWSVVVTGRFEEVTPYDARTYDRVHQLPVDPWAAGEKSHWVRLVPERITGRSVGGAS